MKVTKITMHVVSIPMKLSVRHALAERNTAINVVIVAEDENGLIGCGECCPRDYVTGETIETVQQNITETFAPALLGNSYESFDEAISWLDEQGQNVGKHQLAAFCAIELALLDLAGKRFNVSAGQAIGDIVKQNVQYSGVIAADEPDQIAQVCMLMKQFNVAFVKVKLVSGLAKNREILQQARDILGNGVEFRADANSAWSGSEAVEQLKALSDFNLTGIEQPVAGDDIMGMAEVVASRTIDVVADESVCSFDDGVALVKNEATNVFNLRVSKCGGIIKTLKLYQLAKENGLRCQLGAQVGETSILSSAGVHVATRLPDLLWNEGCFGKFLLADDITTPDLTIGLGGAVAAIDKPGLGTEIELEKLEKYSVSCQTFQE